MVEVATHQIEAKIFAIRSIMMHGEPLKARKSLILKYARLAHKLHCPRTPALSGH
jgi:hypothetical protein